MQNNNINLNEILKEEELTYAIKIRCVKCNALLFKKTGNINKIEIKCRKCGYVNNIINK